MNSNSDNCLKRMDKFCVFCGSSIHEKTKEHVIPKWLIELTGDPHRKAFFGFNYDYDCPNLRSYSFSSFAFPACSTCNSEFSDVEASAQKVILSILNDDKLNDLDVNWLLDWLDKVRIGLWLGFLYLSNDTFSISPKFHIKTRMGATDRILFIYKLSTERKGINFIGTNSPSFLHIPSCFALLINNFCLFNISHFNLCDRRLGFPYATRAYYKSDGQIESEYVAGFNRVFYPVIRKRHMNFCAKFFQPIFPLASENEQAIEVYNNQYVLENSLDWNKGIGKIFQEKKHKASPLSREKTLDWLPSYVHDINDFLPKINRQVYEFQENIIYGAASMEKLSKKDKKRMKDQISFCRKANQLLIEYLEKITGQI